MTEYKRGNDHAKKIRRTLTVGSKVVIDSFPIDGCPGVSFQKVASILSRAAVHVGFEGFPPEDGIIIRGDKIHLKVTRTSEWNLCSQKMPTIDLRKNYNHRHRRGGLVRQS